MTLAEYTRTTEDFITFKKRIRRAGLSTLKGVTITPIYNVGKPDGVRFTVQCCTDKRKALEKVLEDMGYKVNDLKKDEVVGQYPATFTLPELTYYPAFKFGYGDPIQIPNNYEGFGATLKAGNIYYMTGKAGGKIYVTTRKQDIDTLISRNESGNPKGVATNYHEAQALALLFVYRKSFDHYENNAQAWTDIRRDHAALFDN